MKWRGIFSTELLSLLFLLSKEKYKIYNFWTRLLYRLDADQPNSADKYLKHPDSLRLDLISWSGDILQWTNSAMLPTNPCLDQLTTSNPPNPSQPLPASGHMASQCLLHAQSYISISIKG